MTRVGIALLGAVASAVGLAACGCADPAVRASPDAGGVALDTDAGDAPSPDAGDPPDADTPLDLGPVRARDAYVPREPPPVAPPSACASTASMRRLYSPEPELRPSGRSTIAATRWGDGLLVAWQDLAAAGAWRTFVGRVAEPIAGDVDLALSWLGVREVAFLSTAAGGMRLVHPDVYQDVGDDGPGPEVPLPPPPEALVPQHPLDSCIGVEAVEYLGGAGEGHGDTTALLRFGESGPRWSEPVPAPGIEHQLCVATDDGISQLWRTSGTILVAQWDRDGTSIGPPLRIATGADYAEAVAVEGDAEHDTALVVLAGWDDPSRAWALQSFGLGLGRVDPGPRATLERSGTFVRLHGATRAAERIVTVLANPSLVTVELDPVTGEASPPAIVGEHPCWTAARALALPSGLYLPLDCYFEEVWLLRICGDGP